MPDPSRRASVNTFLMLTVPAVAALLALAGCASSAAHEADAANTGLDALALSKAPGTTTVAPVVGAKNGTALDARPDLPLNSIFDSAATPNRPAERPRTTGTETPAPAETPPASGETGSTINTGLASNATAAPSAPKSLDERLRDAAGDLRATLVERSSSGAPRFADKAAIAAIDSFFNPTAQIKPVPDPTLSPTQRSVLGAFAGVVRGFSAGAAKDGDPAAAGEVFDEANQALTNVQNVRVSHAALCRRVMGYGQYDPFPTNTFLAGRPNRALIYVEVDRFSHRAARDRDTGVSDLGWSSSDADQLWAVEVSEELGLWHDADGSLQWRKPEQSIVEVSRKRRRDFYLVQAIDLPETLSVGNYKLKVIIKDKTSGSTDEVTLPIQILADASGVVRPTALAPKK